MSSNITTPEVNQSKRYIFTKAWFIEQKSLIALIALIAVVSVLNEYFFTLDNLLNILRQTSVIAILAAGMTLVILTAGIDLSVGSILALCGAFAASMISLEISVFIAIPVSLLGGAVLGSMTGVIISKGKVQAFIATLVMMTLLRGVTMVYTDGRPISTGFTDVADHFAWFGTGYLFGIPVPVWLMIFVFAGIWYLLNHTRFGRYVYALGGNESATKLSGINVDRIKIGVYGICGLLSALAGIIITSRLSSAQPTAGMG
ncbi:ribose ABC transporter permease, partial [Psychromonas sp. B3M02]|uniref:ribose ABC transporter permease n=1 Tax=Psychromonas sp. B3M02 TaxID=2267226 RepID=UPI000DE97738